MKLKIPLIRQKPGSEECGIACLAMVLKFYNISENSITNISKDIKIDPGVGTYMPQLGIYLLKKGFNVEIIILNQHLFTCKHKNKCPLDLVKHLQSLLKHTEDNHKKTSIKFFIEFIELGGKINIKVPSYKDIKAEILEGRPLICLMTSKFLLSTIPGFNFHFNLIAGIDNTYIYINDPLPEKVGGQKKYPIDLYMYAIHSTAYADIDNASIMKIRKK